MMIEIKSRLSGSVLFSLETESLKLCVEAAVKGGAYLGGADLRGAYLGGAYLGGADLGGADLRGAYLGGAYLSGAKLQAKDGTCLLLVGERPCLQIGPIGSRADYLIAFITDHGVYIRAGCFWDTLAVFKDAVCTTHGTTNHAIEYAASTALIEYHAQLWTPDSTEAR